MTDIFISYRKRDRAACASIANALEAEGFTVWWDKDLEGGSPFKAIIQEKIQSSAAVIVLWTKNSVKSKWVHFETDYARQLDKLVPLRLDNCRVPVPFDVLQTHDYTLKSADPETWAAIVAELRGHVASHAVSHADQSLLDIYWAQVENSQDAGDVQEYLTLFPKGERSDKARARLPGLERRHTQRLIGWNAIGILMYLGILAPVLTLMRDFGWDTGFYFSKLYFHYFAFFLIAGVFMIPIYLWTLAKALGYVGSLRGLRKGLGLICVLIVPLAVSGMATFMEVSTGYAPWELNLATLNASLPAIEGAENGRSAISVFKSTDPLSTSELSRLLSDRGYNPDRQMDCLAAGGMRSQGECARIKEQLSNAMIAMKTDPAKRSMTYWSYRVGFLALAVLFIGSFFNIAIHCLASRSVRLWMARLKPWGGQRLYSTLLNLLALQLGLIAIWFVARFIFQLETASILPASGNVTTTSQGVLRQGYALFVGVYLAAVGGLVLAALRIYEAYARVVVVLISFLVTFCLSAAYSSSTFVQGLQTFIGVKASPISIGLVVIVMFVVVFGTIIMPNIFDDDEDELRL